MLLLLAVACGDGAEEQAGGNAVPTEAEPGAATATSEPGAASGAKASEAEAAASEEVEPYSLTLVTGLPVISATNAHIYAGKELGYYAEEGIDIEFQALQAGGSGVPSLLATGGAEIAYASADPLLSAAGQGLADDVGLVAVCQVIRRDIYEQFIVRADSDIDSYQDLVGRPIGVRDLGRATQGPADSILRVEGVDPTSVTFVAVGAGPGAAQALVDGQVDAVALWDTQLQLIENLGFDVRRLPPVEHAAVGGSILTTRDFLEANPDVVERLLRGMAKSVLFATTNPEAAIRVYHQTFPELVAGADPEEAFERDLAEYSARLDKIDFTEYEDPRFCVFEEDGRWEEMGQNLGVTGVDDWSAYYTNEFVEPVNDFDTERILEEAEEFSG